MITSKRSNLFSGFLIGIACAGEISAGLSKRLASLENKLDRLEVIIERLERVELHPSCSNPGSGSLEDLNEYLCDLSADADQFTEESRAAYVDLQNKVEANTNTINNYERDILELNQQEQDLNQQLNTISDSVECGATGTFQPQCLCNGVLQNGKC